MLKICTACKVEKKAAEFRRDKTRPDGFQSRCKICSRTRTKELYNQNYREKYGKKMTDRRQTNAQRIRNVKMSLGCACCSERHISCIEFHHIDGDDKKFIVGTAAPRAWEQIMKEMVKCVCVCSNCHRKIHDKIIDDTDLLPISKEQIQVAVAE